MQIKLTDLTKSLLLSIAAMPDTTSSAQDIDEVMGLVYESQKQKEATTVGGGRARERREISFVRSLYYTVTLNSDDPIQRYAEFVKMCKDVLSGELLKSLPFIRMALPYGVIHLSDVEINHLIKNNKISS